MAEDVTRRMLLAGGAILAAGGARAQGAPMEELHGTLTAVNAAAFGAFVSKNADRMVSLQLRAAPVAGRGFSVAVEAPLLLVNLDRPERMQVSLTGGYAVREGAIVADGVYAVKAEGMQQGILILVLEPVEPQRVRPLRAAGVRRVALS
jgi:hypothetical protein